MDTGIALGKLTAERINVQSNPGAMERGGLVISPPLSVSFNPRHQIQLGVVADSPRTIHHETPFFETQPLTIQDLPSLRDSEISGLPSRPATARREASMRQSPPRPRPCVTPRIDHIAVNQAQLALRELDFELTVRKQVLDEENAQYLDRKKEQLAKLMEDHNQYWTSEAVRRRYNRTSKGLRNLRQQQILLERTNRVEDAEEVRNMADLLEKKECEECYRLMVSDFAQSRKKMESKIAEDLALAQRVVQRRTDEFRYFANQKAVPFANRRDSLAKKMESEKDMLNANNAMATRQICQPAKIQKANQPTKRFFVPGPGMLSSLWAG
jgi:hypothetical protein